jgi:hypothetical protein
MRVVLKAAHCVVPEQDQPWTRPECGPGRALLVASRGGSVVEDAPHVHEFVGVLFLEWQIDHEPGVNDESVVLRKLEPERKARKPAPVLLFELVDHPLMGWPELWKILACLACIPPLEAMLVVIPTNRSSAKRSNEPDNPSRIRTFGDQISDQNQIVVALPARFLEQVFELFAAAVDISHDEGSGGHISILGASGRVSKFMRPAGR